MIVVVAYDNDNYDDDIPSAVDCDGDWCYSWR